MVGRGSLATSTYHASMRKGSRKPNLHIVRDMCSTSFRILIFVSQQLGSSLTEPVELSLRRKGLSSRYNAWSIHISNEIFWKVVMEFSFRAGRPKPIDFIGGARALPHAITQEC